MLNFRYVKYSDDSDSISGFALCSQDSREINAFFETLISGFDAGVQKVVSVQFDRNASQKYDLLVIVNGKANVYTAYVRDIDAEYVNMLIEDFRFTQYLFIITALNIDDGNIDISKQKYYCFKEMTVDGRLYCGHQGKRPYPIDLLRDLVE